METSLRAEWATLCEQSFAFILLYFKSRVLMGVTNSQLTTNFSAKYQLTTIFLANSQLSILILDSYY